MKRNDIAPVQRRQARLDRLPKLKLVDGVCQRGIRRQPFGHFTEDLLRAHAVSLPPLSPFPRNILRQEFGLAHIMRTAILHSPFSIFNFHWNEKAQTEVGGMAEGERARNGIGKLDAEETGESSTAVIAALLPESLELEGAKRQRWMRNTFGFSRIGNAEHTMIIHDGPNIDRGGIDVGGETL